MTTAIRVTGLYSPNFMMEGFFGERDDGGAFETGAGDEDRGVKEFLSNLV